MQRRIIALVTMVVLCSSGGYGEEFPYRASIAAHDAKVYAGPGTHFYETAQLPVGTEVEVYEHTPGGFCAVRPPEGSFSWLPASAAGRPVDGVAEVLRDQAAARVGSLLHDRRDAVHVRLDQGERVRVLAETDVDGVRWLQIAPPAGEFRWMRQENLGPRTLNDSADSGWVQTANHTEPVDEADPVSDPASSTTPTPPPAPAVALTGEFGEKMATLELELARQVVEIPTLWNLEKLEQHAAQLLGEAQEEAERAAVRSFAARVDRFAAIANRYKTLRRTPPQVALTRASVPRTLPQGGATHTPQVSGYDAVGVLRPVVSKRPGAPQYALVSEQGKIVSFITARSSMNLDTLIGSRVGVSGAKGFMPEYQQQHLTASRVTPLAGALR